MKYLVIALLTVSVMLSGCATTSTTDPVTGLTSTTYDLNTEQLTALVGIGTNVYGLIQQAEAAQDAADANKPTTPAPTLSEGVAAITTILSALRSPKTFKESDVQAHAVMIALAGYTESGKFPAVLDIAKYVASGTFPSEKALIAFSKTGKLEE